MNIVFRNFEAGVDTDEDKLGPCVIRDEFDKAPHELKAWKTPGCDRSTKSNE